MNDPGQLIPSGKGSLSKLVAHLNKLRAFMRANQIVSAPGYKITRRPNGTSLEIDDGKGGGSNDDPRWG